MAERRIPHTLLARSVLLVLLTTASLVACGEDGSGSRAEVSPSPQTTAPPPERRVPPRPGAPRRLEIPRLGVDAAVVSVGLRGSTLVPPSDPQLLGWWAGGAMPGATRGSALIAGHTVHTGGGALDDLERVRVGDTVRVRANGHWLDYRTVSVRVLGKDVIARTAQRIFSQEAPGRLVLLTCENWDGVAFRSNVVVTAAPA